METGFVVIIAITAIVVGIALGLFIARLRTRTYGTLQVDYSDPYDGPYCFLKLKVPVSTIVSKKRVTLDVDITQIYSQE